MSVRRRALFAIVAIAAAAALLSAVPASGAASYSTKVIVSLKFPAFHGRLESPRHGCLGSRKMKAYREKAGPDKLLGTDKSEDNGAWSIPVGNKLRSGAYYVTAAARGKCRGAKSKVLPVD